MSQKDTKHFKRILSNNSSSSGGLITLRGPVDFHNSKKYAKLRTAAPELDNGKYSKIHNLSSDYEPLLNNGLSSSPCELYGSNGFSPKIISERGFTCGHLSPLDFRQDCPRGIMSVTDIELTMGDEHSQSHHCHHHGSLMIEHMTPSLASSSTNSQKLMPCGRVCCDEKTCLWHRCVLKLPHYVRWEDKIMTVELHKKDTELYGFNHKSKQHAGTDEIYTLVSHVEENSKAARSGLALGDLILSVNNVPMQTKQKIPEVDIRNQNKLRLQIQHPLEISSKAAAHVEQLRKSMIKEQMSISSIRLPQPPTPSTSPTGTGMSPTGENIPLFSISKPEPQKTTHYHQLPQARVFVVGNAANEFICGLAGDFINLHHDTRARCFEISMKMSADGSVSVGNSESFSYLFENPSESCINVEFVLVTDDAFFHHCCSWMFTPNTVFILTFDTKRLSTSSQTEMSRLCSLANTVQTGMSGGFASLQLYGVTSADDTVNPEEVQTLFYTSLGNSLPEPRVIPSVKGSLCEELNQCRLDIFSMLMRVCEGQQVVYPTAIILDMLVSHRRLTTTVSDLANTLQEWNSHQKQLEPETFYRVIEDLRNSGILLVTASINASCTSENVKELVLPCVLFDHLSHLAQFSEKDRVSVRQQGAWVDLYNCGIITRAEFLDVLSVCTSQPEKLLHCMEDLHLVFPIRAPNQDSGFSDISNILFAYFLPDVPFSASQTGYYLYMTIEFSDAVPVSSFYACLSELSQDEDCHSLTMRAQYVAHMILHGEDICLSFLKTARQMQVFKNRINPPVPCVDKQTLHQHIQEVVCQQIPGSARLKVQLHVDEKEAVSMANGFTPPPPDADADSADQDNQVAGAEALPCLPAPSEEHAPDCRVPSPVGDEATEEERRQNRVLDMNMLDLKYTHRPLHDLCCYLSMPDTLQMLAGECGLSMEEFGVFESIIRSNPNKLPAQVFLDLYFKEKRVTLREFIQILMRMEEQQHRRLRDLIQCLLDTALAKNS